ncbi:MAG: type III-B CRISPR module-associated Cmr3 family protein [Moraxella sp.]|nr:type III-B CRISPR module-associated Cmr3 family protein [Moraxella sp.]
MKAYLIESLAPLVFRSGKPFAAQTSVSDVIFPLPSAGAGLLRAVYAEQQQLPFNKSTSQSLLEQSTCGVLLARFGSDCQDVEILVPKPANALYLKGDDDQTALVRLAPSPFDDDVHSDLPKGLTPVQITGDITTGKPQTGASYWRLTDLLKWQNGDTLDFASVQSGGLANLPVENRTHVAINRHSQSAEDGKLFQTASYDLGHQQENGAWANKRLGFVVFGEQVLRDDVVTFGGERRLSNLHALDMTAPAPTAGLCQQVNATKGFCLTLLSPAVFAHGYLPKWLDTDSKTGTLPNTDITVKLRSVAIERWQAVSGWDSLDWQPKAMRKAVCAGSVYWFEIVSGAFDDETLEQFYFKALSDDEQDRRDGFGLAVLTAYKAGD